MKNNSILLVGVGIPSELTDALLKSGCDFLRSDSPMTSALCLLKNEVDAVLAIGPLDESWNEFLDSALAVGKLIQVDSLVSVTVGLANGNGNGNGNGHGNGRSESLDHSDVGLTIDEVVDLVGRRTSEPIGRIDHIYTKVGNKLRKVPLDDILYIEVEGKYSALQVKERKYNVKASLKDLLQKLPNDKFVRVSRNFVVNLKRIQHIDTFQYTVKVGEMEIPISRTYKEELMRHINLI